MCPTVWSNNYPRAAPARGCCARPGHRSHPGSRRRTDRRARRRESRPRHRRAAGRGRESGPSSSSPPMTRTSRSGAMTNSTSPTASSSSQPRAPRGGHRRPSPGPRASPVSSTLQPDPGGSEVDAVYELIVNGVFLMDTAEASTDACSRTWSSITSPFPVGSSRRPGARRHTRRTTDRLGRPSGRRRDRTPAVRWLRSGLVPPVDAALADPRVQSPWPTSATSCAMSSSEPTMVCCSTSTTDPTSWCALRTQPSTDCLDAQRCEALPGGVLAVVRPLRPRDHDGRRDRSVRGGCSHRARWPPMTYHLYLARRRG